VTFDFIKNNILKQNLEISLDHIIILATIAKDKNYNFSEISKSSLRQSITIHSASIIEGLLFDYIDLIYLDPEYKWKLKSKKVLYKISDTLEIVGGEYHREQIKVDTKTLNIIQLIQILTKNNYISKNLSHNLDKVRILRNGQHLGARDMIQNFSEKDLTFTIQTLKELYIFLQKEYSKINQ